MSAKNETFSYRHIKDVYTIVLFENSPSECKAFPDTYIHHGNVRFDSGLKIHMPQDFIYIPLDIFRKILHNRGITDDLDAWLTFLCENMEDIMSYYSKALQEIDKNTTQYMIEEQQAEIEEQQKVIEDLEAERERNKAEIKQKDTVIEQKDTEISKMSAIIAELRKQVGSNQGL